MSPRKARRLPSDLPRRPRKGGRTPPAARTGPGIEDESVVRLGPPQTQEWPDGDWVVRQVPGAAAAKLYRCPGCDQEIRPGTGHVVVWPAELTDGTKERRHWHSGCWQRRPRRPPTMYRQKGNG